MTKRLMDSRERTREEDNFESAIAVLSSTHERISEATVRALLRGMMLSSASEAFASNRFGDAAGYARAVLALYPRHAVAKAQLNRALTALQKRSAPSVPDKSMLPLLRRRVAATVADYRKSGSFSTKELQTIEALWVEGISLQRLAKREGVTVQAIEARIKRLGRRASLFRQWWRLKHRGRTTI